MDEERPSLTAKGAAAMRAMHQTHDGRKLSTTPSVSASSMRRVISIGLGSNDWSSCPSPLGCGLKQPSRCAVGLPKIALRNRLAEVCANISSLQRLRGAPANSRLLQKSAEFDSSLFSSTCCSTSRSAPILIHDFDATIRFSPLFARNPSARLSK